MNNKVGAQIFREAASLLKTSNASSPQLGIGIKTLQAVLPLERWDQNMAVEMYAMLSYALGSQSLTEFEKKARSTEEIAQLFERVANLLEDEK